MLARMVLVLRRDLLIAARRRSDVLTSIWFYVLVSLLFPFGVNPDPALLRVIGPGVIWVAALLASMMASQRLFANDYASGALEMMLLSPEPLVVTVLAKVLAHWVVSGLPLVLLAPILAIQFEMPGTSIIILTGSLLLGTPALSFLSAIGAALTLGLRNAAVLSAFLVLPMTIPVLIFGAGSVAAEAQSAVAQLALLGALLAGSMALGPWAIAAALRIES